MRKPVQMRIDEELVDRIDALAGELGLSRTELTEKAWRVMLDGPERVEAEVVREPERPGRKLDTYPSAPSDPEARSDWTAGRVLGWSGFGRPARVLNADLIAEQQRKAAKG